MGSPPKTLHNPSEIQCFWGSRSPQGRIFGEFSYFHKICEILLTELQAGKLGRITLETPAMLEKEKIEMAEAAAKKAADKAKRKEKFKQGSATPERQDRKERRNEKREEQSKRMKKQNRQRQR